MDFSIGWLPSQYAKGYMMTGWEMPNNYTLFAIFARIFTGRISPPANGRQFVANDLVAHYNGYSWGQAAGHYYASRYRWAH